MNEPATVSHTHAFRLLKVPQIVHGDQHGDPPAAIPMPVDSYGCDCGAVTHDPVTQEPCPGCHVVHA